MNKTKQSKKLLDERVKLKAELDTNELNIRRSINELCNVCLLFGALDNYASLVFVEE